MRRFFEGPRRIYSAAVIGTIASVAPTLGPVIGGWITDTLDRHWRFYTRWRRVAGNAGHLVALQVRVAFDNEASYGGFGTYRRRHNSEWTNDKPSGEAA